MRDQRPQVLALALLLDLTLGDPPNRLHPVAWMGSAISGARRRAPRRGHLAQLAYGGLVGIGGALAMLGLGRLLERLIDRLPYPFDRLARAATLKVTLSVRGLTRAAREVEAALETDDLPEARRLASWHLVGRDTSELDASQVAAAVVESVAESASDGIIAPLLAYAVGGLPGALVYRFINTADSMLGYRDAAREWLGKGPARLDDLVNLVPSRATAALLTLAATLVGEDAHNAWRIWRRDSGRTASPNAGHPMSAMAGALDVELEKVDHYRMGVGQHTPSTRDIERAVRLMRAAVALGAGSLIGLTLIIHLTGRD